MSTFFKALERAEQERALGRPKPASEPTSTPGPATPVLEPVPAQTPSVFRPPRPVTTASKHTARLVERASELEEHLVSLLEPTSFEAEQYRALRHMIEQLRKSAELSVIAVSSAIAADGKTTTAINLAGTLAQAADARILLIDADLRSASVAAHLGLGDDPVPGLVDAILNTNCGLESVTQTHTHLNLSVITAGRRPSAPYEVLKATRLGELLAEARRTYDYVIVDTPPLVSVPDSRVLGKWVDGFLIVVAAHHTPRKLLEEAFNLMEPTKVLGMVFNGDDRHVSKATYASQRRVISRSEMRRRQTASDE